MVGPVAFGAARSLASPLIEGFSKYATLDYARAREIISPLAQMGSAEAQQLLGFMYANGEGIPQDSTQAVRWFSLAAEQGRHDAQLALGIMYRDGAGVSKDRDLALKWIRRAAENGHSDAANVLGELYLGLPGALRDYDEAVVWFEFAALIGNGRARYNLGVLFLLGQGVRRSDIQAYMWFDLSSGVSADFQNDVATHALNLLRERMMPSQVEEAIRLVTDWTLCAAVQSGSRMAEGYTRAC